MRKIAITHIESPVGSTTRQKENCFNIYLGNGHTVRFSSTRLATDFMVQVNLTLNYKLVTINQLLIETYTSYRKMWFYVSNHPNHKQFERTIHDSFDGIDQQIFQLITKSNGPNGNHFVFRWLNGILDLLDAIMEILQKIEKYSKHYVEVRMLQVHRDRLEYCREEIMAIGEGQGNVKIPEGHNTF